MIEKEIRIMEGLHKEESKIEIYRDIKFKIDSKVLKQYEYNKDVIKRVMQEIAISQLQNKEIQAIEYDFIRAERIDNKFYEMKKNGGLVSKPVVFYR